MSARGVLRVIEGGMVAFWCPGCEEMHAIPVQPEAADGWTFDHNYERPTFSPSILVRSGHFAPGRASQACWCTYNASRPEAERVRFRCMTCHSFVRDGRIEFLSDSTHELAGKTVELTSLPQS